MIDSKDISVVVQGAINKKETKRGLKSIRKFLPKAEIILSTWEGSNVSEFGGLYDILVLNKDPGAVRIEECKHRIAYNNLNRQLLSTQEGLKKADRKYVMKLRSDLIFADDRFLGYFDKFQKRNEEYKLFERKIMTSALITRYTIKSDEFYDRTLIPFHVSDWWLFGLRSDLETYFMQIPLVHEPYFTNYFSLEENKNKKSPYGRTNLKFAPEQYFAYSCFSRYFKDIYMEDGADYSDKIMEISRKAIVNNFIVLEFEQSGIYLNKYPYSKNEKFSGDQYIGLYHFYRYENEYKKYCENSYQITAQNAKMFKNEKYGYDLLRIYKHIAKLFEPETKLLSKFEQIFISIPLSSILFIFRHYKELW